MKKPLFFSAYILFLIFVTIFSYTFIDANLIYLKKIYSGFSTQNRLMTTIFYTILLIIFFLFYLLFLRSAEKKRLTLVDVKLLIGVAIGILIFSYPAIVSYDIFNYLMSAKVLYFYRENPYIVMPIEFLGDPFLLFTHAANKYALYGPFWLILSGLPFLLGFGNFILTLLSFKLFIILFYLGTIILIWNICKNVYQTVFFALHPLVLIETLIGSHNDVVMMFLVLLSFYLVMRKKVIWAIVALLLSILIKYATLFLIPVFIYTVWKMSFRKKIEWENIFMYSWISMMVIFFLSPLREEMYPWYAIWFLVFASFLTHKKFIFFFSLAFSFGLLLRYIPFMLVGTHFGITPPIKVVVTLFPPVLVLLYLGIKRKLWSKKIFQ